MTFRFHADRLQITIASSAGESKLVINGKSEN
jgi:hypothetical protein